MKILALTASQKTLSRNIWLKEQRWQLPPTYIGQTYFPYPTLANVWGTFACIKSNMTWQFFADANCAKIHINGKNDKQFMQKGLSSLLIWYQAHTLKDLFDWLLTSLSLMLIQSQYRLVTYLQSSFNRCYSSGQVPAHSCITLGHVWASRIPYPQHFCKVLQLSNQLTAIFVYKRILGMAGNLNLLSVPWKIWNYCFQQHFLLNFPPNTFLSFHCLANACQ